MFLIKSWFKSNHSSLTLWVHKRWFPLKVKWILTYIFLSLRILFFRIPVKAVPVQATQYVKLGSLIKGIDVFAMKGCTKELIVFKVNLGVILMLKKRRTNIKKAKANKKKNIKYGKQRLLRRKWSRTNLCIFDHLNDASPDW